MVIDTIKFRIDLSFQRELSYLVFIVIETAIEHLHFLLTNKLMLNQMRPSSSYFLLSPIPSHYCFHIN